MLSGRADAPDATLLRALAAAQLDAATRPTISFLHVSAAGGTSLCLTARSNGLAVPTRADGRWNNCWDRALRDGPRWRAGGADALGPRWQHHSERAGPSDSCAGRLQHAAARGYDFLANENVLTPRRSPRWLLGGARNRGRRRRAGRGPHRRGEVIVLQGM